MSYDIYKSNAHQLQQTMYTKFHELLYVDVDDDLGWIDLTNQISPIAQFAKTHGPPIGKIVIHVNLNRNTSTREDEFMGDFAEYSYYIFTDGSGYGFIPTKYVETCDTWLKKLL